MSAGVNVNDQPLTLSGAVHGDYVADPTSVQFRKFFLSLHLEHVEFCIVLGLTPDENLRLEKLSSQLDVYTIYRGAS